MWLFWILALAAIVLFFQFFSTPRHDRGHGDTPEQILKRRYARGEITREEYDRILNDLRK